MNKYLFFLATLLLPSVYVFAQDIIVTKDSKRVDAKVFEVNINDVKYKDWDNLDGPLYTILKSDIASILYQNGKVETFSNVSQPTLQEKRSGDAPQGMTLSKFKSMSDNEQKEYFEKYVGGNIYETFYAGVKLSRAGKGLLIPGVVISTAGFLCTVLGAAFSESYTYYHNGHYYTSYNYDAENAFLAGLIMMPIGQAIVIASIPVSAIGGAKKRSAQNKFINTYFNTASIEPSLDFGVTKSGGVGLTLKF